MLCALLRLSNPNGAAVAARVTHSYCLSFCLSIHFDTVEKKLRIATTSLTMSVCSSLRMENMTPTGRIFVKFNILGLCQNFFL
jgi:hypothetical protein